MNNLIESCCSPCPAVQTTSIPGAPGTDGATGASGSNGINSFTFTTADFVVPAINANVIISVGISSWAGVGQKVFVEGAGIFEVVSVPTGGVTLQLKYLDYADNTNSGNNISTGAKVSPSGTQPALSAALPNAITFSAMTSAVASDIVAAGVGIQTLAFYIEAATIANGDLLTDYVPGYRFKILKFDARCSKPVTTGAKASTLNLEIDSTNLTGGVIALAGTYALGAAQAGTAVTANNVGTATQAFSIEASATTAFVEGAFWLIISIANLDTQDAVASLSDHVNDLITSLT